MNRKTFAWIGVSAFLLLITMYFAIADTGLTGTIRVDPKSYVINIQSSPMYVFNVKYVDTFATPIPASKTSADILKDDVIVKSVNLTKISTGEFLFQCDFSAIEPDDYVVRINVDSQIKTFSVRVVDYPSIFGIFYDDGVVNRSRVVGCLIGLGVLAVVVLLFLIPLFKKRGVGRK
jgi:hypothetical protein